MVNRVSLMLMVNMKKSDIVLKKRASTRPISAIPQAIRMELRSLMKRAIRSPVLVLLKKEGDNFSRCSNISSRSWVSILREGRMIKSRQRNRKTMVLAARAIMSRNFSRMMEVEKGFFPRVSSVCSMILGIIS